MRRAISSWQSHSCFHMDGEVSVEVVESDPSPGEILPEDEFLEFAANAIGGDADEIDALLHSWTNS